MEARAPASVGTCAFDPPRAEFQTHSYAVAAPFEIGSDLVLNEMMAVNRNGPKDPQGETDDWIEIHNRGPRTVDLSGMQLSDCPYTPAKWTFPEGTRLESGGYLVVWTDGDVGDRDGLHASFRLSGRGETLTLRDRGGRLLDRVELGPQKPDAAVGRLPDGRRPLGPVTATPGRPNGP